MVRMLKLAEAMAVALAFMLLLLVRITNTEPAAAEGLQREVQVPVAHPHDPVVITEVTFGDARVQAGRFEKPYVLDPITPFEASEGWPGNLSIQFLNRSNLSVSYLNITVGFPEARSPNHPQALAAAALGLGRVPDSVALNQRNGPLVQPPDRQPLSLGPGQALTVRLGDHLEEIRRQVEPLISPLTSLSAATKIRIDLALCYFADGMNWSGGGFQRRKPWNRRVDSGRSRLFSRRL